MILDPQMVFVRVECCKKDKYQNVQVNVMDLYIVFLRRKKSMYKRLLPMQPN